MLVIFTQAYLPPCSFGCILVVFWHRQDPQIQISSCHHTSDKIIQSISTPWTPCLHGIWCSLFYTLEIRNSVLSCGWNTLNLSLHSLLYHSLSLTFSSPLMSIKRKSFISMHSGSDTLMLHCLRSANLGGYSPQSMYHLQMDRIILHFHRDFTHFIHLLI